jgi:DNA-binding NtrC family response regulator
MQFGNGRTVLLVEDDQAVRKLISGVLEASGYHVLPAVDGESAVAAAGAHLGEIHLMITDFGLGEMNGLQVAASIAALRPGIGILLISGYTEIPVPSELRIAARAEFLAKPFTMEAMLSKIRSMLALGDGGGRGPAGTPVS